MNKDERKEQMPIAYPKPSKTDKQLDNQDEFVQSQTDKKNDEAPVLKNDKLERRSSSAKNPRVK